MTGWARVVQRTMPSGRKVWAADLPAYRGAMIPMDAAKGAPAVTFCVATVDDSSSAEGGRPTFADPSQVPLADKQAAGAELVKAVARGAMTQAQAERLAAALGIPLD